MNRRSLLFTLFLLLSATFTFGQTTGKEVMLQGFNWESHSSTQGWYNVIGGQAADLQASGIDAVWLPPSSDAASDEGYLPRELYKLSSNYGSEAELRTLISELHNNNIKVLADIVINHRVGLTGWGDFTNPTWGCWGATSDDEWPEACGEPDTGTPYDAARDINHRDTRVRDDIKEWMNWLKNDVGFDGWRYDYVHGFGANYVKEYNDATSPYFSVGELWDGNRQLIIDWIDGTQGASTAFDFPTKFALHAAVTGDYGRLNDGGKAPGIIGVWPEKAVTFIDNHDTGSTQNYDPFPGDHVMQGYAYILTHPGTPMVFWDHLYDWGLHDEIANLITVRKENDLSNSSSVSIQRADGSLYAAIIDNKVAMKIGGGSWSPSGSGWVLRASGNNYAVWDNAEGTAPEEPAQSFTIHFKRPADWGTPIKIHHWGASPSGSLANSTWPGEDMINLENDWYSFTFPEGVSTTNLLFHDNLGNQTADLSRGTDGWYMDGSWYNSNPEGDTNEPQPPTTAGLTIYFQTDWSNPTMHFWDVAPAGAADNTTWPGVAMQAQENGWWSYTIEGASCANLIFSNNGSSQTADLYRCENGWYMNGTWYDSDPTLRVASSNPKPTGLALGLEKRPVLLEQNYPNPVTGTTFISFSLDESAHALLKVYTILGEEVAVVADGFFEAGRYTIAFEGGDLPSGVYKYMLSVGDKTLYKRMVIRK